MQNAAMIGDINASNGKRYSYTVSETSPYTTRVQASMLNDGIILFCDSSSLNIKIFQLSISTELANVITIGSGSHKCLNLNILNA